MGTDWWAVSVEGLIAGAVVLLGVIVGSAIERSRARRRSVEVAYQEAVNPFHAVIAGLTDAHTDTALGTTWRLDFDRLYARLLEIKLQARHFRGAGDIADAAQELIAFLVTASLMTDGGWRFRRDIAAEAPFQELGHAIFGERPVWDRERYEAMEERVRNLIDTESHRRDVDPTA